MTSSQTRLYDHIPSSGGMFQSGIPKGLIKHVFSNDFNISLVCTEALIVCHSAWEIPFQRNIAANTTEVDSIDDKLKKDMFNSLISNGCNKIGFR
jgi:hypothetical protein